MNDLRAQIVKVIETIYDPEIPVNIWELGLIYRLDVSDEGRVAIEMTLTAPACPEAESLPPAVEQAVAAVPGVTSVTLDLVWDPPWDPERMSEAAKLELGFE
jgi:FeS assembly SUF system protein